MGRGGTHFSAFSSYLGQQLRRQATENWKTMETIVMASLGVWQTLSRQTAA
jgi:hypothetical protein